MRTNHTHYGLFCMLIFLCSCFAAKPGATVTQGLSGYIYQVSGNQMPGPGRPQSKGHGVSRTIYIYTSTHTTETDGASPMFTRIKTRLIVQIKSDSTGHYTVKLPPGNYSVFIAEKDRYFAAESDGSGTLNPIMITADKLTKKDFILNNNAAY